MIFAFFYQALKPSCALKILLAHLTSSVMSSSMKSEIKCPCSYPKVFFFFARNCSLCALAHLRTFVHTLSHFFPSCTTIALRSERGPGLCCHQRSASRRHSCCSGIRHRPDRSLKRRCQSKNTILNENNAIHTSDGVSNALVNVFFFFTYNRRYQLLESYVCLSALELNRMDQGFSPRPILSNKRSMKAWHREKVSLPALKY